MKPQFIKRCRQLKAFARAAGLLGLAALFLMTVAPVHGCKHAPQFVFDDLWTADVIVRATAVGYVPEPKDGTRAEDIEFRVEETLFGKDLPNAMALKGYLSDKDDYNKLPVPYRFMRSPHGPCYAETYKRGAQFLLFLRKKGDRFTSSFKPLAPTNEQLRGPDDPWIVWVRAQLTNRSEKNGGN